MLRRMPCRWVILAVSVILGSSRVAHADVRLPALVSDGMVLQQKAPVRIWGWAADGERVTVTLRGQSATAEARGGQWAVTLKPLDAGGPFEMTIAGRNTLRVKDVLVGEVWLCSGQSNMEFSLDRSQAAKIDIDAAADPMLRMFTVQRQLAAEPKQDVSGGAWQSASPESRGGFSAVGFYFGRALRAARGVPVGLIHASWGGTPAEAWTSRPALEAWGLPESAFEALGTPTRAAQQVYERNLAAWAAAGKPQGAFDDPGVQGAARAWSAGRIGSEWRAMALPRAWEQAGPDLQVDGAIWFRREVTIPEGWKGRDLEVSLGAIDDADQTFFNGVAIGAIGPETPSHWAAPRRYTVGAANVRAGAASVAVRVWDHGGDGGVMGPATAMWVAPAGADPRERISLAGEWRFKPERTRPSMPMPPGLSSQLPSVLYNGMIAPVLPYTIKGATWYQGESNTGRAAQYRSLLAAMIRNWRADFGAGEFPFLIVQLAPYMAIQAEPQESNWALLREAQHHVTRDVPNAALAVITDVGDPADIHPTKKRPVGERLALAARKLAYGEGIVASGPTFRSAAVASGKVTVSFDNVGKGLEVRGGRLTGFAIAGADRRFVNAEAAIVGDRVVVSSPKIAAPAYVRFGWADYPVVNLWNADGLPAVPFRTDAP